MHGHIKRPIIEMLEREGIDLEKKDRGRYYIALCPFHEDSSPSMQVWPDKDGKEGGWTCYSCNPGRHDVIDFFMQMYPKWGFVKARNHCCTKLSPSAALKREIASHKEEKTDLNARITIARYLRSVKNLRGARLMIEIKERADILVARGEYALAKQEILRFRDEN